MANDEVRPVPTTRKWDADEMNRRRREGERFSRGLEPVTRNELLEALDAVALDVPGALWRVIADLRSRWDV